MFGDRSPYTNQDKALQILNDFGIHDTYFFGILWPLISIVSRGDADVPVHISALLALTLEIDNLLLHTVRTNSRLRMMISYLLIVSFYKWGYPKLDGL